MPLLDKRNFRMFVSIFRWVSLSLILLANLAFASSNDVLPRVEGLGYDVARTQILNEGWMPVKIFKLNALDLYAESLKSQGFVEVEACGGSGLIPCSYLFKNSDNKLLRVVTVGEGMPHVELIRFVTSGPDDGGQKLRALAYQKAIKALEFAQIKSQPDSLSKLVFGKDIPRLNGLAESLLGHDKAAFVELATNESNASKRSNKGGSDIVLVNEPTGEVELAVRFCAEQTDSAENVWDFVQELKKSVLDARSYGIQLGRVTGDSVYDEVVSLRNEHAAKGDVLPYASANDLEITHDFLVAVADAGLSKVDYHKFAGEVCSLALAQSFPEVISTDLLIEKYISPYAVSTKRVRTKDNVGELGFVDVSGAPERVLYVYKSGSDLMYDSSLSVGDFSRAASHQISILRAFDEAGYRNTALYVNGLNKLAAAYMLENGDGDLQARRVLEQAALIMPKLLRNNQQEKAVEGDVYRVLLDTTKMLEYSYNSTQDSDYIKVKALHDLLVRQL